MDGHNRLHVREELPAAEAVFKYTGIRPVCQSWQCTTSGLKPLTGSADNAALQKKENFQVIQPVTVRLRATEIGFHYQ